MATSVQEAFDAAYSDLGLDEAGEAPEEEPVDTGEEPTDEEPEEDSEFEESEEGGELDDPEPEEGDEVDEEVDPDEDAEDEADEDDADEPDEPSEVIELDDEAVVVLPDGTELSGEELRKGHLRHADYTRKTQELAEKREELEAQSSEVQELKEFRGEVEEWYAQRASNPAAWVQEIVEQEQDPTVTFARALKSLAKSGSLDSEFLEAFGLEAGDHPANELADKGEREDRIARVERELEERKKAEKAAQTRRQQMNEYRNQLGEIVEREDIEFSGDNERREWVEGLVSYARQHEITDLRKAYAAMAWEQRDTAPDPEPDPAPKKRTKAKKTAASKKKRATRAMTPRSASKGSKQRPKPETVRDAAQQALDEFAAG